MKNWQQRFAAAALSIALLLTAVPLAVTISMPLSAPSTS